MNHLQHETSPYLLQHAHNPVNWYAWKPEAFERARLEDKPILVSIGYSTCHWCHVMERESFENEAVAALMNQYFVCIKVDREERPDVDAIYMEACQILTGAGGWPLNCFLTPDGKPFYAGTYDPPKAAFNRPGWPQLLEHLANIWATQRDVAFEQSEKLLDHIRRNDNVFVGQLTDDPDQKAAKTDLFKTGSGSPSEAIFYQMREKFDRAEGGFGGAPKFPSSMAIQYLLNYHHFTGNSEALDQALLSLDKMIQGGIYDQLGGGFARYATDREWLAPHFEKMLYDNALLVSALSAAYQLTGKELYRETVAETLAFIQREMTHPEGGIYSAYDADSEGEEGKFYVWDKQEIEAVLGGNAALFGEFYDVSEEGNWEGKNILRRLQTYEEFALKRGLDVETLKQQLKTDRDKLFAVRAKRIWPGLDDKVILGWNALMVSAYAAAFNAFGEEEYRAVAQRIVEFLLKNLGVEAETPDQPLLRHTWKAGQTQYNAFLDDYTFFSAALVDVYQITFDVRYLHLAGKYTAYVLSYFPDPETDLFFLTDAFQTDLVLRKKDLYDNATPSGNSTLVHNLQRLGILLDRREWREKALQMLGTMQETVGRYPLSFERWALAMLYAAYPYHEIAVVGANAIEKARTLQRDFLPNRVVAATVDATAELPLLAQKTGAADALIYVCRDFACQRPVVSLE
ncbi:MAG: thioredoxin domain-containing protein, partial [Saprospiraceae bacterium]